MQELITLMRKKITNRIAIFLVHATSTIIISVAIVFVLPAKSKTTDTARFRLDTANGNTVKKEN